MKNILGLFLLYMSSMPVYSQKHTYKEMRESLSDLIEALDFYPDSIDLRLQKAGINIELEQWQYAKDEYDIILNMSPNNPAALFYRAFVNTKLQRYNFARADYESLLHITPMHFEGRLGLALLNQQDSHYTDAFNQINKLVELFPDSAIAYAARGGIEEERGMHELAEFDYGKAIGLDPENKDYRLLRANIRIFLRRKKEARADLDELVKMGIPRINLSTFYDKCK